MTRAARRQGESQQRKHRSSRTRSAPLEQINLNAAGIDVGSDAHWVAVPRIAMSSPYSVLGHLRLISTPWLRGYGSVRLRPW